jgi:anti-sigma B factor antagonist
MKFKTHEQYNAVVIELKGNVMGGDEAKEFNDLLHKFLDEGKKNVVLDLSQVTFMNSSGLGMLIGGLTTMKKGGGHLKLSGTTEKIQSLLVITKLTTIFESYETLDEAINSFPK